MEEATHSYMVQSKRTNLFFDDAGFSYVHRIHMQNCIDVVTLGTEIPGSVLIRVLEPTDGIYLMKKFRNKENIKDLTTGPGKLCQALNIDRSIDGVNLKSKKTPIYILDDGFKISSSKIVKSKRTGIS